MSFSTADCKALLSKDLLLSGQGLAKADWKRISKRNGPHGPERVFSCAKPFARHALVIEDPAGLWIASESANIDDLQDASIWRANPFAPAPLGAAPASVATAAQPQRAAPAGEPEMDPFWRDTPAETDRMKLKAAQSLAPKAVRGEASAERVAALVSKGLALAIANQFEFAVALREPAADGSPRFGALIRPRDRQLGSAPISGSLPLESLLPLGSWAKKGGRFDLPSAWSASPALLAQEMTRRGFSHSDDLQAAFAEGAEPFLGALRDADRRGAALRPAPAAPLRSWREGPVGAPAEAARIHDVLAAFFSGEDDDEGYEEIRSLAEGRSVALANQFAFFLMNEDLIGTPAYGAAIYPIAGDGIDSDDGDREIPLDGLLPEDASDLNGSGTWVFHDSPKTAVEIVRDLIGRGFRFDEKAQRKHAANVVSDLAPLWESDAIEQELAASARGAAQKPAAGPSWRETPLCADRKAVGEAKRLLAALMGRIEDCGDDENDGEDDEEMDESDAFAAMSDWAEKHAGTPKAMALANQFSFFVTEDSAFGGPMPTAIVTPTVYSEAEDAVYDQECPISALLPEGAEDLNGCGTWMIAGYPGGLVDLVRDLIGRGFHFHERFQRLWGADNVATLQPLWDADALAESVAGSESRSQPPKRRL